LSFLSLASRQAKALIGARSLATHHYTHSASFVKIRQSPRAAKNYHSLPFNHNTDQLRTRRATGLVGSER